MQRGCFESGTEIIYSASGGNLYGIWDVDEGSDGNCLKDHGKSRDRAL